MTFNLRRDTRMDRGTPNEWAQRIDLVADVILEQAPDVLATQEGTLPQLRSLDERLPGYERVGGADEAWPGEEPNAIYYDPERIAVLDAGVFWLSRTPLVAGSRTWGDWARRSALWARLALRETGAPLIVVNTHFDHISVYSRRRSAQLLQRVAPGAVLMGDFNARPRRFVHGFLLEGRVDPLEGARDTHNLFTMRDRGRIDWILVPRGLRVRKAAVLSGRVGGRPVSDHRPVVVDIEPPAAKHHAPAPRKLWNATTHVPTKLPPVRGAVEKAQEAIHA